MKNVLYAECSIVQHVEVCGIVQHVAMCGIVQHVEVCGIVQHVEVPVSCHAFHAIAPRCETYETL